MVLKYCISSNELALLIVSVRLTLVMSMYDKLFISVLLYGIAYLLLVLCFFILFVLQNHCVEWMWVEVNN